MSHCGDKGCVFLPKPDRHRFFRTVFGHYRELGSVMRLRRELDERGILVPERTDGAGRRSGGMPFSRGHLYGLLANPIHAGRIGHKGRVHEGQHAAIIDPAAFDAVQAKLAANTRRHSTRRATSAHLLTGRIRTSDGQAMTPSHARKGPVRYRYYVSQAVLKGDASPPIRRLSAPAIEATVTAALRAAIPSSEQPETTGRWSRPASSGPSRFRTGWSCASRVIAIRSASRGPRRQPSAAVTSSCRPAAPRPGP